MKCLAIKIFAWNFLQLPSQKRSFIKIQTSGTSSDNEWYNEWQRMTTSDNEWQRVVQRVTTSGTVSGNEWQRVTTSDNEWQSVTTSDKEWQRVVPRVTTHVNEWSFQLFFLFFFKQKRSIPLSTLRRTF